MTSKDYLTIKLLDLVDNYFSNNKTLSMDAEIDLLDRTISGSQLIDMLNEAESILKGASNEEVIRLDELKKEYDELIEKHNTLVQDHTQLENYVNTHKPLIDYLNSRIKEMVHKEVRQAIENKSLHE